MENLKAATPKKGETPIKERRKDEKPVSYRFFVSFLSVTRNFNTTLSHQIRIEKLHTHCCFVFKESGLKEIVGRKIKKLDAQTFLGTNFKNFGNALFMCLKNKFCERFCERFKGH